MIGIFIAFLLVGWAAFTVAILMTNGDLRAKLVAQRSRSDGLRKEAVYWTMRAGHFQQERNTYRDGLDQVIALSTRNMANIGRRMFRVANTARELGKSQVALPE